MGVRGDAFSLSIAIPTIILNNLFNAFYLQTAGKERKTYERVKNHRLNVLFNAVSEIKFPEGKYGHPLFYHYFVSNLCEYAKNPFHFINIIIEDTREQKYFIVHQYSTIKDGSKNSCDKHQNHVLPNLCGAGGHQTGMDI